MLVNVGCGRGFCSDRRLMYLPIWGEVLLGSSTLPRMVPTVDGTRTGGEPYMVGTGCRLIVAARRSITGYGAQ